MKIENMKLVNAGTIKAFFDIDFEKIKIRGCKIIKQDNQTAWVSGPDEKYTKKDGGTAYRKLVDFVDADLAVKVKEAALKEMEALSR